MLRTEILSNWTAYRHFARCADWFLVCLVDAILDVDRNVSIGSRSNIFVGTHYKLVVALSAFVALAPGSWYWLYMM